MHERKGFTLIEILVVVAIIGVLAAIISVAVGSIRTKARDTVRKADITQMGKILSISCYLPTGGGGEYDLADLFAELQTTYPQLAQLYKRIPHDPGPGTDTETYYRYVVNDEGTLCALYANLENDDESVTLTTITTPTAGGGSGVFEAASDGWNRSPKYFQISN